MSSLNSLERLIIAFDPAPNPEMGMGRIFDIETSIDALASALGGTGVTLMLGPSLRAAGYGIIRRLNGRGFEVLADLELQGSSRCMGIDGLLLAAASPAAVTASPWASDTALRALKAQLPNTRVLMSSAFSDYRSEAAMFVRLGGRAGTIAFREAKRAATLGLDGSLCQPDEVQYIRRELGASWMVVSTNTCPSWARGDGTCSVNGETVTPAEAFNAGASHVVVRLLAMPLDPWGFVMRLLDEIESVVD